MKFAILGAGNTGKAYSAFLSHGGIRSFSMTGARAAGAHPGPGISATGVVEGASLSR